MITSLTKLTNCFAVRFNGNKKKFQARYKQKCNTIIKQQAITIFAMIIVIVACALVMPKYAYCATESVTNISQELNDTVVNELNEIDFSPFNDVVNQFELEQTNMFSITSIKNKVYSIISGENAVSYSSMLNCVLSLIGGSIFKFLPLMSVIIAIGVIGNMLSGFKSKFSEKSTSN